MIPNLNMGWNIFIVSEIWLNLLYVQISLWKKRMCNHLLVGLALWYYRLSIDMIRGFCRLRIRHGGNEWHLYSTLNLTLLLNRYKSVLSWYVLLHCYSLWLIFISLCNWSTVLKWRYVTFQDMLGNWKIRANEPGEELSVSIESKHPHLGNYFSATLKAKRIPPTRVSDPAVFFWLMPHKVAIWIYWHVSDIYSNL